MNTDLLRQLKRIVGPEHVYTGRCDLEVYSYDASLVAAAPDAVVLPADTEQTAAVVRAAVAAGVPCVPRGFGTNLSGGSIAPRGGIILGLSRLNRILEVRPEGRYAVVQAGATNLELQNALAPLGFYFAPDPASQKAATLGGNIGENAGGPHCLKYGVTSNHILGMTAVMPDGEVIRIAGPALDPPGYDLRGLLIGSEGTLAIVTEVVVRILPTAEALLTLLAVYDDVADAARSVSDIIAAGIVPATLEMMDGMVIRVVEESKPSGYPCDAAAVLIAEVDGPAAGLEQQAQRVAELCRKNRCREVRRAKDAAERDLLWAGRRGAFGALARAAPSFLPADCTVPRTRLPEALARVGEIAAKHSLRNGNVFHAGDGNMHPVLLFDPRDAEQTERVHQACHEIMEACVALGGTITGEHGVGTEKAEAMRLVFSEDDLDFQRRIRAALDPKDLLNPGKIFPRENRVKCATACENDPTALLARTVPGTPEPQAVLSVEEWAPADAAEACDMVRRACRDHLALVPRGNGTQAAFGNSTARPAIPLRSARLVGVTEYDPAAQVIGVRAGTTLESLQDVLAENGQWLPLCPPLAASRTIGGIVALGACGPERLRYGAPRDLLLGLKFVSGEGRLISAGGRVVKNVAGYEVTRLLAGSAGTLGFIAEVITRVLALPQSAAIVAASGSLAACGAAADALLRSKIEPNSVVAVPEDVKGQDTVAATWRLLVGFEGFAETVDFQVASCCERMERAGLGTTSRLDYSPRQGAYRTLFDAVYRAPVVLRADVPPDCVVSLVREQHESLREAAVLADFGCGRITLSLPDLDDAGWQNWCRAASRAEGYAIVEKAPDAFRIGNDVFGPPRPDWPLMRRLKAALDPQEVFSPGRMPGKR